MRDLLIAKVVNTDTERWQKSFVEENKEINHTSMLDDLRVEVIALYQMYVVNY